MIGRGLGILWMMAPVLVLGQAWTQLPDFPGTARDDAAAFAIGDRIYVGTGLDIGFQLTTDWYAYSPATMEWSSTAPLPASGRQYCASFAIDGIGYLFGGTDGSPLNELWAYHPQSDQWIARAPLPSAGRSGSVGFMLNGKGFIATGKTAPDLAPSSELWMYDPVIDEWSARSPLPASARALAAVFTIGDSAYLFTGQDGMGLPLADGLWNYVASTDTWSFAAPFLGAGPMFDASGFGLADRGVVVCGAYTPPPYVATTDVFMPSTGQWMWTPPLFPGPGRKGGRGAVMGNTIYYGTGTTGLERLKDWYALEWPVGLVEQEQASVVLSPNPATHIVRLDHIGDLIGAPCRLMDATGRSVALLPVPSDGLIDITDLALGRYTILIHGPSGAIHLPFIKVP